MNLQDVPAFEVKIVHPKRPLSGALTPGDIVEPSLPINSIDSKKFGIVIHVQDHRALVLWSGNTISVYEWEISASEQIMQEEDALILKLLKGTP